MYHLDASTLHIVSVAIRATMSMTCMHGVSIVFRARFAFYILQPPVPQMQRCITWPIGRCGIGRDRGRERDRNTCSASNYIHRTIAPLSLSFVPSVVKSVNTMLERLSTYRTLRTSPPSSADLRARIYLYSRHANSCYNSYQITSTNLFKKNKYAIYAMRKQLSCVILN